LGQYCSKFRLQQQAIIESLNDGLLASLKYTRKFNVMTYQQLEERLSHQGLRVQGYYDKSYVGEEYRQVGLDYILTANVRSFDVFEQTRGKTRKANGLMEVDLTLHGVADATEDYSDSVTVRLDVNPDGELRLKEIGDRLVALGVNEITDRVLVDLFPIRVMKFNKDSSISLNYGAGIFDVGDTVLVYPHLEDDLLNSPGRPSGNPIATLQIMSTDKKFAIAQALDGYSELEKGQKGLLLKNGG